MMRIRLLLLFLFVATVAFAKTNTIPSFAPKGQISCKSNGHILSFEQDKYIVASTMHGMVVHFEDANTVNPERLQVQKAESISGNAQPDKNAQVVSYKNLWDRVNVTYETREDGIFESTYYLKNRKGRTNVDAIRLRYNRDLQLDKNGNLMIDFSNGTMTESAPIAWQVIDGIKHPVKVSFKLYNSKTVGFSLGAIKDGYDVVIDPTLQWNSFVGPTWFQGSLTITSMAQDSDGSLYVCGTSSGAWGVPVFAFSGELPNAYLVKLNPSGYVLWNTFLGQGTASDVTVDGDKNVYVCTEAEATWGSPLIPCNASTAVGVVKLSTNCALIWNTFLGGWSLDSGRGIQVDASQNVYVAGISSGGWGTNVQRAHSGGLDGFISKLSSTGSVTWTTFLGGSDADQLTGLSRSSAGDLYAIGSSPSTWGAPVSAFSGTACSYLAKVNNSGVLQWNTFIPTGYANTWDLETNNSGVYVAGESAYNFGSPVAPFIGPSVNGYVAKYDFSGNMQWNTFIGGGSGSDAVYALTLDPGGNVYLGGESYQVWGSPLEYTGTSNKGTIIKLNPTGSMLWNTFLPGGNILKKIMYDPKDKTFLGTGRTTSEWGTPNSSGGPILMMKMNAFQSYSTMVSVTNKTSTGALLTGKITDLGTSGSVNSRGFCWSTSNAEPTLSDSYIDLGASSSTSNYSYTVGDKTAGSKIYARTFTTKNGEVNYSDPVVFYTKPLVTISGSSITVNGAFPGCITGIETLTESNRSMVTQLTITGAIDARDFRVMRDSMPLLNKVLISGATIVAYEGTAGTLSDNSVAYVANVVPGKAFLNKVALQYISLPSTATTIGTSVFEGCTSLTSVGINSSVEGISSSAFKNCSALTALAIPNTLTILGADAFSSSALVNCVIPNGVAILPDNLFKNCSALKYVSIPASVSQIGNEIFSNCAALSTILSYRTTPPVLNSATDDFSGAPKATCIVRVPAGSLSAYRANPDWILFVNIVEGMIPATLVNSGIEDLTSSSATYKGGVISLGDVTPVQYGVVWSTSPNPTIGLMTKTQQGVPANGAFSSSILGLQANTTYYVRAYSTTPATNLSAGTTYSAETSFTTRNATLTLAASPGIQMSKLYDGKDTAFLTSPGVLSGVNPQDVSNVTLLASAHYDNANTGSRKIITVTFKLTGSAAGNYTAPVDFIVSDGEICKALNMKVFIQGMWNGTGMDKCKDWNEALQTNPDKYSDDVVDKVTVELHSVPYSTTAYTLNDLLLHQNGSITSAGLPSVQLPSIVNGSYYLTIKGRNFLETTSSGTLLFTDNTISYDFSTAAGKAYGNNQTQKDAVFVVNSGDLNSDGALDISDINLVLAKTNAFEKGFIKEDFNGDSAIDATDILILLNNINNFISVQLP